MIFGSYITGIITFVRLLHNTEDFDEAWNNVVYDELAPISSRDDFCFEIMRDWNGFYCLITAQC